MSTWKPFIVGIAGVFAGIILLVGIALAADILTVDKDGTVRLRVSDTGKVTLNTSEAVEGDLRFTPRAADPTAPLAGDLWYNSADKEVKYADGGLTKPLAEMTNAALSLYVNGTTGDDNNNGLASGTAVKTIQKAINLVPPIVRHAVTINVASGIYTDTGATVGGNAVGVYVSDKFVGTSGSITIVGGANLAAAPSFRVTGDINGDSTPDLAFGFYISGVRNVNIQGIQSDYFAQFAILYTNYSSGTPSYCIGDNNKMGGIAYYTYSIGNPNTCQTNSNGLGAGAAWPKTGITFAYSSAGSPTSCTTNSNGETGIRYVILSRGNPTSCTCNSNLVEGIKYVSQSTGDPTTCTISSNGTGINYVRGSSGAPTNNTGTSNNTNYGIYSDSGSMVDYSGTTPGGNTAATGENTAYYARIY